MCLKRKIHIFKYKNYIIKRKKKRGFDKDYYYINKKLCKIKEIYITNKYIKNISKIKIYHFQNDELKLYKIKYYKNGKEFARFKNNTYEFIKFREYDISNLVNNILKSQKLKGYIFGTSFKYTTLDVYIQSVLNSNIKFNIEKINYFCDGLWVDKVQIIKLLDYKLKEHKMVKINNKWYKIGDIYEPNGGINNIRFGIYEPFIPFGIYENANET